MARSARFPTRLSERRRTGVALFALLAFAAAGFLSAPTLVARLSPPVPLAGTPWTVKIPGLDQGIASPGALFRTGVVDGALYLATRSFGRADTVSFQHPVGIARIGLTLAPDSGPLRVNLVSESGQVAAGLQVTPDSWTLAFNDEAHPYDAPFEMEVAGDTLLIEGVAVARSTPGTPELAAVGRAARIRWLQFVDSNGETALDVSFAPPDPGPLARLVVTAAFALAGLLVAVSLGWPFGIGRLIVVGLLLLPPIAAATTPYTGWLALHERLYLGPDATDIAGLCIAIACLPLAMAALQFSGALDLGARRGPSIPPPFVVSAMVLVGLVASRDLHGPWLLAAIPGLAFLAVPVVTAWRVGVPAGPVLLRDAPAVVAIGLLGWGPGLLPAALWRLQGLVADAPTLLERHPRAGTDALFALVLSLLLGVELLVRSSPLGTAWDPDRLAGTTADPGDRVSRYWSDACGVDPSAIYWFGGSSIGGAYQFLHEPDAFIPAQVHERLCTAHAVTSFNHGGSGRDSFDVASAAGRLYGDIAPSVAVFYGGVNDFTRGGALTRREQADLLRQIGPAGGPVTWATRSSRALSGVGLLLRAPEATGEAVIAVPIPDAEANLRALAAATIGAGGHLLLVTEYAQASLHLSVLEPYWQMEARLAREIPGVHFVDLYPRLDRSEPLLVDQNHLTREGSVRVAEVLTPVLAGLLDAGPPGAGAVLP